MLRLIAVFMLVCSNSIQAFADQKIPPIEYAPVVQGMRLPIENSFCLSESDPCFKSIGRIHHGIDIFAPRGTPVVAVTHGTVFVYTDPDCGLGLYLVSGRWSFLYCHLNNRYEGAEPSGINQKIRALFATLEGPGDGVDVLAGTLLGWVGNSGNASSTPSHLHLETQNGHPASLLSSHVKNFVNPVSFLNSAAVLKRPLETTPKAHPNAFPYVSQGH